MKLIRFLGILWASPYTIAGLALGLLGLCTGGKCVRRWPLEFYGGAVTWLLCHVISDYVMAMTLGHVILGRNQAALDICRSHELVHVRQFERWGPFLGPAYIGCSLFLKWQGKDGYLDNPFEKEAFGK